MDDEQLLMEIEEVLRTMPARATLRHDLAENLAWFGRASAVVDQAGDIGDRAGWQAHLQLFQGLEGATQAGAQFRQFMTVLYKLRAQLLMRTRGPLTTAFGAKMVFDYFDEIRKIVETAKQDAFFIDPYLDAEFVSRYLPHVTAGVPIRLLARDRVATLMPAVRAFVVQHKATLEVRTAPGFHDRYVIVDRVTAYHSGASFKDGARSAPTTITQVTDAFDGVLATYEQIWAGATVVQ